VANATSEASEPTHAFDAVTWQLLHHAHEPAGYDGEECKTLGGSGGAATLMSLF
jgi:hypothetical protein